jgi:stage II sporulation protein D
MTLTNNEGVTIQPDGERIVIEGPGTRAAIRAAEFDNGANGVLTVETPGTTRRYRGRLLIDVLPEGGRLRLVNYVAMPDYLTSVVASEYPFDDIEGTKSQAVIARTYVIRARQSSDEPYDVTDNTASQAYLGFTRETDPAREAVRTTRGEILTYDDRAIEAVYSSSGGGHTADNEDVWDTSPVPYLRGKPDPYDESSPHQEWHFAISKPMLHTMLSEEYGFQVQRLRFEDRTDSGRYHTVRLEGEDEQTITVNTLRFIISRKFGARSLKSTLFRVRETSEQYVFEGQGFGHGVGLSQWGAHARAEDGQSYEDILQFYYTSVALETLDGEQIAAAEPARPTDQPAVDRRDSPGPSAAETASRHGGWGSPRALSLDEVETRPVRPGW